MLLPFFFMCATLAHLASNHIIGSPKEHTYDVVVYGGTSGGFASAIQLSRLNRSVALIEPSGHFGGIAIDGFGASDVDSQVHMMETTFRPHN